MLDFYTAGFVQLHDYESWNATTHVGTNLANATASTSQQRITVGTAASVNMYANHCIALQSTTAAGIGASNVNEWTGVF